MYHKFKDKKKDREKALALPPSIAEQYVGLRTYLGDGIYLMENGDLATTLSLHGISDEILTEDELYSAFLPVVKFVQSVGKGIPSYREDSSVIIQMIASQRIEDQSLQDTEFIVNDAGKLLGAEIAHLLSSGLIKRTFYLTVRWSNGSKVNIIESLMNQVNSVLKKKDSQASFLNLLVENKKLFHREIVRKLIESGLKATLVSVEDIVSYYNSVLNYGSKTVFALGDDDSVPLWENIVNSTCSGSPEGFKDHQSSIKVFTFTELPLSFALGRFRQFIDSLPMKTWEIVWTLSHVSRQAGAEHVIKKMFFSQGPSHRKKYEDLLSFEDQIDNFNPMGKLSVKLIAYNCDEELEGRIFSTSIDYLSCPIICEKQIGPHLIASSLPMNCSKEDHNIIGRFRTVLLDRAISFAPLYTASSYEEGKRMWIARDGEPIKLDLFGKGGNNHVCVLGNSESGKSCLMTQFNIEFLWRFPSGVIRIIDRKTSYRKLCDLFNGKIIAFNEAYLKENPYSPFAYEEWDDDDIQNTVVFLQNAILQLNPEAIVTGLHTEILTEAIKLTANDFEKNIEYKAKTGDEVDPHPTWIDIKKKLPTAADSKGSNNKLVIAALDDIRRWTVSFDHTGQFGFLFCRHERADSPSDGAKIVVYDLDGIADPRLQIIASQLAFLKISRDLKKVPRKERKLVVFEELGVLVAGESPEASEIATRFIRNVVKTARKIGAQAIGISNELHDFTRTEAGKAFWKIAPQKLFLPMSQSAKNEVESELSNELSRADVDVVKDLIIKKGFYSQGYLISQNTSYKGSFLIPLSPIMNAVVTTNAKEEDLYSELRKAGYSPFSAIEQMASKHPYGDGL